jgi:hypothetical protein
MTTCHLNIIFLQYPLTKDSQFIQPYNLKQGVKTFGECGKNASLSEMNQLYNCEALEPVHISD